jgi:23S rRNA (uracil1939-C5)-methyltransferase
MNDYKAVNKTTKENVTLECLRLISDGSGIGYLNGIATFVPGLLPGETGEVEVYETKKKWQRARLLRIIKPSPERIAAPCSVFGGCGGCQLQHMTYEETLLWKNHWVEDALSRIGKISVRVKHVIGMPVPWRYRNKARLHREPSGRIGYYKEKSKDLVHFPDCLLLSERMNRWIRLTEEFLTEGYAEIHTLTFRENTRGEGLLLLEGPSSLTVLIAEKNAEFFAALFKEGIRSVWRNDSVGGLAPVWGTEVFRHTILGMNFNVSPFSFLQVNPLQTEVLYSRVLAGAALTGNETVWDLYSGIGTLTLALASKAKKVTGIEENPYAVKDAIQNAVNNADGNVEFLQGKVELQIMNLDGQPDVVVLDPPRTGMHPNVRQRLLELKPQRIIYVSCDPGTLARDLGVLTLGGYRVESVQPLDMFPWTQHVESIVLMTNSGFKGK